MTTQPVVREAGSRERGKAVAIGALHRRKELFGALAGAFATAAAVAAVWVFGGNLSRASAVALQTHGKPVAGLLSDLRASSVGHPFAGDRPLLATVFPADPRRNTLTFRFDLARAATVTLEIAPAGHKLARPVYQLTRWLAAGDRILRWRVAATIKPRSYLSELDIQAGDRVEHLGARSWNQAHSATTRLAPVIRVLGIAAGFAVAGTYPDRGVALTVSADEPRLFLQWFRFAGPPAARTSGDRLAGTPVGAAWTLGWRKFRNRPRRLLLTTGDWPSALYFLRLSGPDGTLDFAPLVVWPRRPGASAGVAVVVPTNTWQAYNFDDENGDGFGDTWYAGWLQPQVTTGRPYLHRGVPLHFAEFDAPALRWLAARLPKGSEMLSDGALERLSGSQLRASYRLLVFEGHEEYVSDHVYHALARYRDLGGHIIFLSANNIFWRIVRRGQSFRRTAQWRDVVRPEAALVGAQYRASNSERLLAPFHVEGVKTLPWLFAGCGLDDGDRFGDYGVEVDSMTVASPPGTRVAATIPGIYGRGINAQMTYYERPSGAEVFDAGALDFGGSLETVSAASCMTANLIAHLRLPGRRPKTQAPTRASAAHLPLRKLLPDALANMD